MKYRIERRNEAEQPTGYWNAHRGSWLALASLATVYSESERELFLRDTLNGEQNVFPAGGCWVVADEPRRNHFTVLRLQPVAIRLSTTKEWSDNGEYESLNAQALEFEAALRQWIAKQQILTGPEWGVDIQTED